MKTLAVVCTFVLTVASCIGCKQQSPTSTPPFTGQFTLSGQALSVDELQSTAQDSVPFDNKLYVSMEVVFHAHQAAEYPVTSDALQNALATWADVLPVRLTVYVEDPSPPTFFLPFGRPSFLNRWNIIEILMDDLQAPPFNMRSGILGIWQPNEFRIILDADTLETDVAMAYSVALHELGHMFGLPHLVGWNEPAPSGWIVLPDGQDASEYLMYPSRGNKSQDCLSQLEIDVAKHHLLHTLTSPGTWHTNEECNLTHGLSDGTMVEEDPVHD